MPADDNVEQHGRQQALQTPPPPLEDRHARESTALPPQTVPAQRHTVAHAPFSWSASLLTMLTILGSFGVLCTLASYASTQFAFRAARPMYGLYPSLVASMLIGGVCACICYLPTMLAVVCFVYLFDTDIRKGGAPPPGMRPAPHNAARYVGLVRSLLRDGANTIKLALIVAPLYVMAAGNANYVHVESRALEAAGSGQLVAALMTLKIMLTWMKEFWNLVPLVVLAWDRQAR
ncbi:hypothetical protein NUW54_g4581 [Trametes sanguinea]|uniref:Uncharacterized protein n=1 Tax=Trametes sanguinea TaxID=158606 RepID=A0ACC1PY32_9APHY|nr:hypothetical protein NUW54_g4581 [Trametes sanguinea]